MKRTERIAIALTKDEKARIRIEASDLHISMSALIRMRIFAQVGHPSYQSLPSLNRPPRAPTSVKMDITRGNMVHVIIELQEKLVDRRKIVDEWEENLLEEVEIK